MAVLTWDNFTGIFPRQGSKRLPIGAATVAKDVKFDSGRLMSRNASTQETTVASDTQSIHRFKDKYWLTSSDDLFYVDSPVVQDQHSRVYIAGGDYPVYAAEASGYSGWSAGTAPSAMADMPSVTYRLGISPPLYAPVVSVNALSNVESEVEELLGLDIELQSGQSIADWLDRNATKVTTSYVYTYVTEYGEESAPSPPSSLVDYYDGQTKALTLGSDAESGTRMSGGTKRIYRVATGTSSSEFLFVAEVSYATTSYTDTSLDVDLAEPITSTKFFPPPNDDATDNPSGPLKSLILHPQGFLAGHAGRTLAFSQPYLPHAWDPADQISVPSEIIGLCISSSGIVVGTKRKPYLVTGNSPSTMDLIPLDSEQPCVSQRSMVEIGGSVIFASYDGLVAVSGAESQLITEKHFDRSQWANYYPESIHAYTVESLYIGFYKSSDDTVSGGFVFDLVTGRFSELSFYAKVGEVNDDDDILYLVEGSDIKKFDQGALLEYTWKSGEIRLHNSVLFQRFKIEADHSVGFTISIDGQDKYSATVVDSDEQLLPAGLRGEYMQIELKGKGIVDLVSISDDPLELEP